MSPSATTGDKQEYEEASGRTFLRLRAAVAFQAGLGDVVNLLQARPKWELIESVGDIRSILLIT